MNIRDLQYLVTLADLKHFGRAAEACFVSQPTLSTQIRKLEDELGVQIFERAPRKVLLTEVGKELVERAKMVLRDVEQIREVAKRTKDPHSGSVRLGVFPTLGPYLLPHIVPPIHQQFPNLELLLFEEKTEELMRQLAEGRLDAALLALPLDDDSMQVETLFEEPFVMALPSEHELNSQQQINLQDIANETVLLLEDGHCLRDQALEVCQLAGASEKREFRATSLETLRQMVAASVGITLLPCLAVKPPIAATQNLKLIPFEDPAPSRTIGLVWRRSSALGPFLTELAQVIKQLPDDLLEIEI